mgnify:CR=1 FL=1|jgi:hypothetical protein
MFRRLLTVHTRSVRHFATGGDKPYAVYANYRIYKGKGSLAINAIPPTFRQVPGANGFALSVERPGVMLLEFVPTVGERKFDYNRKQLFALSAAECGDIVAKTASGQSCSLIHDPSKYKGMTDVSSNSGDSPDMKRVNVDPMTQGDGFFVSLTSGGNNKISIPVSSGEFIVVRQLLLDAIPHLLGFDAAWNLTSMEPKASTNNTNNYGGNSNSYNNNNNSNTSSSNNNNNSNGSFGGGNQQQMGNNNTKPVFNPFENQQGGGGGSSSGGSGGGGSNSGNKGSNWLDEL